MIWSVTVKMGPAGPGIAYLRIECESAPRQFDRIAFYHHRRPGDQLVAVVEEIIWDLDTTVGDHASGVVRSVDIKAVYYGGKI